MATDRISAFDYILATGIPHKGRVLTQISLFWFDFLSDIVPNHLITADVDHYPQPARKYADQLRGRSMLVRRAEMFPVECVVRGYVSGSAWKEYKATGRVCGIELPTGLRESDALTEPIFTPATKAVTGHDENISFEQMSEIVGAEAARAAARLVAENLFEGGSVRACSVASSSPTRSLNSGARPKASRWPTKCSRRILPASGRPTNTQADGRRNHSTSSTFATIWNRFAGTSSLQRPRFRKKWRAQPARSIWRPISS